MSWRWNDGELGFLKQRSTEGMNNVSDSEGCGGPTEEKRKLRMRIGESEWKKEMNSRKRNEFKLGFMVTD